jgi:hypothetical protein
MSVVVLVLHPTMADDEDHLPVEPHNFNYGIGRWESQTSSKSRTLTNKADIISHAFPG